ncbi:YokU family protein [Bacillus gobiensis]|uniref:YokU family protein n=1 Tax=Bacillus gobiensis TaxID=1441095 RepID=UPI003D1B5BF2
MKTCDWCEEGKTMPTVSTVYWELPDGSRAIEITETPAVSCLHCRMNYQEDQVVKEIENQLLLIDTKTLPYKLSFEQLMNTERILKRNYFDFS